MKSMMLITLACVTFFFSCAQAAMVSSLQSREGFVTVTFDKAYESGLYANGSPWVVGPVVVTSMSPALNVDVHGYSVNPSSVWEQSLHWRAGGFTPPPPLPLTVVPGESLIKVAGFERNMEPEPHDSIQEALIVTVVAEEPPVDALRPPYFGNVARRPKLLSAPTIHQYDKNIGANKPLIRVSDIDIDQIPLFDSSAIGGGYGGSSSYSSCAEAHKRPRLDHRSSYTGRYLHPKQSMPDYGADAGSYAERLDLAIGIVQDGLDLYAMMLAGRQWNENGGHGNGRKVVLVMTSLLLHDTQMQADIMSRTNPGGNYQEGDQYFHEDAQVYIGEGGVALYGQGCSEKQYWDSIVTGPNSKTCRDPYKRIDGGLAPGTAYQVCCNSKQWIAYAFMIEAWSEFNRVWNYPPFLQYMQRYWSVGSHALPDDNCAPPVGTCQGGTNDGQQCFAREGYGDMWCDGSPCVMDESKRGVEYGEDGNGGCIKGSGAGRFPHRHHVGAAGGGYGVNLADEMYNTFSLGLSHLCFNFIQDGDETGVDCGGRCRSDVDGDTFFVNWCSTDAGMVDTDCNDFDPDVRPSAIEVCSVPEIDDNCDDCMHESYYVDTDRDGVNDCYDNCVNACNTDQNDADGDGFGDVCDQDTSFLMTFSEDNVLDQWEKILGSASIQASCSWSPCETTPDDALRVSSAGRAVIVLKEHVFESFTMDCVIGQRYTAGGGVVLAYQADSWLEFNVRGGNLYWRHSDESTDPNLSYTGTDDITLPHAPRQASYNFEVTATPTEYKVVVTKDGTNVRTFVDNAPLHTSGRIGLFENDDMSPYNYVQIDSLSIDAVNPAYDPTAAECTVPVTCESCDRGLLDGCAFGERNSVTFATTKGSSGGWTPPTTVAAMATTDGGAGATSGTTQAAGPTSTIGGAVGTTGGEDSTAPIDSEPNVPGMDPLILVIVIAVAVCVVLTLILFLVLFLRRSRHRPGSTAVHMRATPTNLRYSGASHSSSATIQARRRASGQRSLRNSGALGYRAPSRAFDSTPYG